jgi:hypothetical protein
MPAPALRDRRAEACRLLLLAGIACWLFRPLATGRLVGAGDALWYANMLADFVIQLRAGIFPIFAGQTRYNFVGGVYPLRVAPIYQHLAGVIDLFTGRHLGFFALQHLCLIAAGVGGIYACYFALVAVAPGRRWTAAALATLYLSCPGVLAIVYTQDLYMSWMAVPFAPLAVYGMVRTFQRDDLRSQLWLAAPLAALWWAHAPIALWMTGVAALTQLGRLALVHRRAPSWGLACCGTGIFVLLAQYPFVSAHFIATPGLRSAVTGTLPHLQQSILENIHAAFPAILLPVSTGGAALGDLQLGYALWAILIIGLLASCAMARSPQRLALRLLLAGCFGLLLLLLPVPGITDRTWAHLPGIVKRITIYWPMQRFYLILASLLAFAGQLALAAWPGRARRETLFAVGLCLAAGWSLWEARKFVEAGLARTASPAASARALRPENLLLTDHAYGLFSALPSHFSNGVMDPLDEARLLQANPEKGDSSAGSRPAPLAAPNPTEGSSGALVGTADANPGVLDLSPPLRLEPGQRYELVLAFGSHDFQGILQLVGREFFREYALPMSGESLGFGSRRANSHAIPLWTTNPAGDEVALRFIPTASGARVTDFADFGSYTLEQVDPSRLPVEITSLMPFRATVRSSAPAWLETLRMFMPGYAATVDGRPADVRPSPDGLVMVRVAPGVHAVELRYAGPLPLRLSYWAALATWAGLATVMILPRRSGRTKDLACQPAAERTPSA